MIYSRFLKSIELLKLTLEGLASMLAVREVDAMGLRHLFPVFTTGVFLGTMLIKIINQIINYELRQKKKDKDTKIFGT